MKNYSVLKNKSPNRVMLDECFRIPLIPNQVGSCTDIQVYSLFITWLELLKSVDHTVQPKHLRADFFPPLLCDENFSSE